MTIGEAIALMTAVAGLILAIIAWRKAKPEKNKLDAETLESLQATLGEAVELNQKLQARISGVEERTVILLAEIRKGTNRISELERINKLVVAENRRLEKYVKMLIEEIQRRGGEVPPMPELIFENEDDQKTNREE